MSLTPGRLVRDNPPGGLWPYRRQLTQIEAKSAVDPLTVDAYVAKVMGKLMQEWPKVLIKWRQEILTQVIAALDGGDPSNLLQMAVDAEQAGDLLHAALLDAAAFGVSSALDEANNQGIALATPEIPNDPLELFGRTMAEWMGGLYVSTAAGEALRLWDTKRDPGDVADDVDKHLTGLSESSTRDRLGGAVNGGINYGRMAAMGGAPGGVKFYASEIRDTNTCDPCLMIDGYEFANQEEADASYPTGGYIDCLGRYRCRGLVVAVYDTGDNEEEQ